MFIVGLPYKESNARPRYSTLEVRTPESDYLQHKLRSELSLRSSDYCNYTKKVGCSICTTFLYASAPLYLSSVYGEISTALFENLHGSYQLASC